MKRICGLRAVVWGILVACAAQVLAASTPLGAPGLSAVYRPEGVRAEATSAVASLRVTLGPADRWEETGGQWLRLEAVKQDGGRVEVWMLCGAFPDERLADARSDVLRYLVKEGDAPLREYRHAITQRAVLPGNGAWAYLLPRPAPGAGETLPETVNYLGHAYHREALTEGAPPEAPSGADVCLLRPDVLTGVPHNTRQVDETRRYDESDYEYIPLETADFEAMIVAGLNCFNADASRVAWFEEAGVFYWGVGAADLPYPECLYRPLYIGPALFLDEPAVVTRDYTIRPRLREDEGFRRSITVRDALAAFEGHYAEVIEKGAPTQWLKGLSGRADVDLGAMQFVQPNVYCWETMVSAAAHELLYHPETPDAIVFEPPGRIGTRRTLPAMNMSYGCQIPVTGSDHFIDIIIGFLRGAARASGKEWGISIYGGVDRTEAEAFITRAYELGATRFFYWDSASLACVPFGEVLDHTRHLSALAREYPNRDLPRLLHAGEVAILLPPGYNLGHVYMGKGILWGLPELNLERLNGEGIPYRAVMGNFFTEIERCIRQGTAFDLIWDLPQVKTGDYREVVRIREDGQVEVAAGGQTTLLDGPRIPERSAGQGPRLELDLAKSGESVPCTIEATARVQEGDAPVYYAPVPDAHGVHHNQRVLWELYGPNDEDYRSRAPEVDAAPATGGMDGAYESKVTLRIEKSGRYRLRAAASDLAGRSAVVWKDLTVP